MMKFLIAYFTLVPLFFASSTSCPSLKKISGSENWHFCSWSGMTNCGDGCCCQNGYEYKNGACVKFATGGKCCFFPANSISFRGDLRPGATIRALDGCTSWTCGSNGLLRKEREAVLNANQEDLCKAEPQCEDGFTKKRGYGWVGALEFPIGRVDVTRKACADACNADGNCLAYTAEGMCMSTQMEETFADSTDREIWQSQALDMGVEDKLFTGINYCVKDGSTIGTGPNSCDWKDYIREFTNNLSKEECAWACSVHNRCQAIYMWVKNPFTTKPLCVGFSQACTGKYLSSSCPDDAWCGFNVVSRRD